MSNDERIAGSADSPRATAHDGELADASGALASEGGRDDQPIAGSARALLLAICIAGGLAAIALYSTELLAAFFRPWNDARLAPSAALLHGQALYHPADDPGAIWSFIYGPLGPLVYIPAALLPTPATAIAAGLLLTPLLVVLPATAALAATSRARGLPLIASAIALALYCLYEGALRGPTFWIHVDAPALAFCSLACAVVARAVRSHSDAPLTLRPAPPARALIMGAALAAAAFFTKQVALPLGPALAVAIFVASGVAPALRFTAAWGAALLLGTLLTAAFADWDAFVFNTLSLPAAHPWQWGGGGGALVQSAGELATLAIPLLIGLSFDLAGRSSGRDRIRFDRRPRALLLLVALGLATTSVLGRVKIGAHQNAQAYALLFLAIAAAGAVADAATSSGPRGRLARATLGVAILLLTLPYLPRLATLPGAVRALPHNPEHTAYMHALRHPGTTYFPYHPLVTLMAEGRGSHVSYGIYDRALAGHPVSNAELRAHLAPDLRWIALWQTSQDYVLQRLPEFTDAIQSEALPGWVLRTRPGEGPPRESAPVD